MAEDDTRMRLIEAAIHLFGREGLEAIGTRAIAEAAGVQLSAIAYHFRTKDGLYLACAEHIAGFMLGKVASLLETVDQASTAEQARVMIEKIVGGLVMVMLHNDIAPIARFIVREQMSPTPAFAVLYNSGLRHVIEPIGRLIRIIARDQLSNEEIAVRCHALMGQVFGFRVAQAALMEATGWKAIGPREILMVRTAVLANVRAILTDLEASMRG